MALCEGERREDFSQLEWKNVDIAHAAVTFHDTKGKKGLMVNRTIGDMRPRTLRALRVFHQWTGRTSGNVFRIDGFVYANLSNIDIALNRPIRTLTTELVIPDGHRTTLRCFRHTGTNWDDRRDNDVERVRVRMGWTTKKMAYRYIHLLPPGYRQELNQRYELDRY